MFHACVWRWKFFLLLLSGVVAWAMQALPPLQALVEGGVLPDACC